LPVKEDGVTVCIAAVCKDQHGQALILCSDKRLDEGAYGTIEAPSKTHAFPWNWAAMMAGSWHVARGLCESVEVDFAENGQPKTKVDLLERITSVTSGFAASILCPHAAECELLITGFIGKLPVILRVYIHDKQVVCELVYDQWTIGTGSTAAQYMLRHRGHNPLRTGVAETCYLLYEAKRFSEIVNSVGPSTRLMIHRPAPKDFKGDKSEVCICTLSEADISALEQARVKFGLQSIDSNLLGSLTLGC
jgi:hypothetical protein